MPDVKFQVEYICSKILHYDNLKLEGKGHGPFVPLATLIIKLCLCHTISHTILYVIRCYIHYSDSTTRTLLPRKDFLVSFYSQYFGCRKIRYFIPYLLGHTSEPLPCLTVSDQTRKQQVLDRSIRGQLEKKSNKQVRMELYTAMYESDNHDLIKNISVFDVSGIPLSRDEAQIVGLLASRNASIISLKLKDSSIDDERLGIIAQCVKDHVNVSLS